ncbi:hypothetical protein HDU97_005469 [Phlyctochytrium planicorne]|nr:hypothetical protein HDU97_005469 [Phlyctochytrium planicorne]
MSPSPSYTGDVSDRSPALRFIQDNGIAVALSAAGLFFLIVAVIACAYWCGKQKQRRILKAQTFSIGHQENSHSLLGDVLSSAGHRDFADDDGDTVVPGSSSSSNSTIVREEKTSFVVKKEIVHVVRERQSDLTITRANDDDGANIKQPVKVPTGKYPPPNFNRNSMPPVLSVMQVSTSLIEAGVSTAVVNTLRENGVDGGKLFQLTDTELSDMGIEPANTRTVLLMAIHVIRGGNESNDVLPTYS